MDTIDELWRVLNGRKTYVAMFLAAIYFFLTGTSEPLWIPPDWLAELMQRVLLAAGGLGLGHKVVKGRDQ